MPATPAPAHLGRKVARAQALSAPGVDRGDDGRRLLATHKHSRASLTVHRSHCGRPSPNPLFLRKHGSHPSSRRPRRHHHRRWKRHRTRECSSICCRGCQRCARIVPTSPWAALTSCATLRPPAVVCADINKAAAERALDLISKIEGGAPKAIAVVADVGKEADIVALVAKAVSEFGRLDVMLCVRAFLQSRNTGADIRT